MLKIGIDLRCLESPLSTGVAVYAKGLIQAILAYDKEDQFFLYTNALRSRASLSFDPDPSRVRYVRTHIPNKLLHASIMSVHRPYLDRFFPVQHLDFFFSPHMNVIVLSRSVRYAFTIHDLSFLHFPDCFTAKQRLWHRSIGLADQCKKAKIIFTPSEHSRDDIVRAYDVGEEKVCILHPGLSFSGESIQYAEDPAYQKKIREKYHLPNHFFLFVGALEPRKNVVGLIQAYRMSRAASATHELVIAGPWGWKSRALLHDIAKDRRFHYLRFIPEEEKMALYRLADVFVYPSLYEGFGLPVLEAMAAGVPLITSNRSSFPEVTNGAAYLVNPMNSAEISGAMDYLIEHPSLCATLVEKGKKRAEEFRWSKAAQIWVEKIQELYSRQDVQN